MNYLIFKKIKILITIFVLFSLSSCTSLPSTRPMPPPAVPKPIPTPVVIPRQTIGHVVAPGETLWRISKTYDVSIEDIMRANNLGANTTLEMGQCLTIPNAKPATPVISLYPSQKWKYIIIHHSATDVGSALTFNDWHKRRGFIHGLGYHFVVDNGSSGKADGYIEVSPRWLKQQNGAHCKASGMNYKGIGICLVGNYSKGYLSENQFEALVYLVNLLRDYYKIPLKNILGHGQVSGANTQCPGKLFPWTKFIRALKTR